MSGISLKKTASIAEQNEFTGTGAVVAEPRYQFVLFENPIDCPSVDADQTLDYVVFRNARERSVFHADNVVKRSADVLLRSPQADGILKQLIVQAQPERVEDVIAPFRVRIAGRIRLETRHRDSSLALFPDEPLVDAAETHARNSELFTGETYWTILQRPMRYDGPINLSTPSTQAELLGKTQATYLFEFISEEVPANDVFGGYVWRLVHVGRLVRSDGIFV